MNEEPSDEALMAAYAAGDNGAFGRLFARLGPRIYAFFLRSFRDSSVADELLQTTFLKVHRARASYRAELPLKPWVFAIAAHVRRDELRRRYRIKEDCDEDRLAEAEQAQAVAHGRSKMNEEAKSEAMQQVRAALEKLPESQRVVIQLHRYEEMPFHEIARVLGLSEVAVRGRAFRAYEQLRKELLPLLTAKGVP